MWLNEEVTMKERLKRCNIAGFKDAGRASRAKIINLYWFKTQSLWQLVVATCYGNNRKLVYRVYKNLT